MDLRTRKINDTERTIRRLIRWIIEDYRSIIKHEEYKAYWLSMVNGERFAAETEDHISKVKTWIADNYSEYCNLKKTLNQLKGV